MKVQSSLLLILALTISSVVSAQQDSPPSVAVRPTIAIRSLSARMATALDPKSMKPRPCVLFTYQNNADKLAETTFTPTNPIKPLIVQVAPDMTYKQVVEKLAEAGAGDNIQRELGIAVEKLAAPMESTYAIYVADPDKSLPAKSTIVVALAGTFTQSDGTVKTGYLLHGEGTGMSLLTVPGGSAPLTFSPQQSEGIQVDNPKTGQLETLSGWRANIGFQRPSLGGSKNSNTYMAFDGLVSQFNNDRQANLRFRYGVERPLKPVSRQGTLVYGNTNSPVYLTEGTTVPKAFYQFTALSNQGLTTNSVIGEAGVQLSQRLMAPSTGFFSLEPLQIGTSLQVPYAFSGFSNLDTFAAQPARLALSLGTGATLRLPLGGEGGFPVRFDITSRRWFMFSQPAAGFYQNPSQLEFSLLVPTSVGGGSGSGPRQFIQISYFSGQTEQQLFGPNSNVPGTFSINLIVR